MRILRMELSPSTRFWLRLIVYSLQLMASLWMAYELRFEFALPSQVQYERLVVLAWLVPLQLLLLAAFHQMTSLLSYFSTPDLSRMFHALLISAAIASAAWLVAGAP